MIILVQFSGMKCRFPNVFSVALALRPRSDD